MVKVMVDNKSGVFEADGEGHAWVELTEEQLKAALRDLFPAGDPMFQDITWEEQNLYNRKNQDYAGGGTDPNGNFHRAAQIFSLYPGLSLADPRTYAMVQMMKQIDQVLWSLSRGFEGSVEGLESRLGDIYVYAKIMTILNRRMSLTQTPEKVADQYIKDRALSLEDLLSRGDAMLDNLVSGIKELRGFKDEITLSQTRGRLDL